jgi:membrane-bound lytic murein transglycosylase B
MLHSRLTIGTLVCVSSFVISACSHQPHSIASAASPTPPMTATTVPTQTPVKFKEWTKQFSSYALSQGIQKSTIDNFNTHVQFLPRVIELDRKQPDSTKTFDEYLKLVIPESRFKNAKLNYAKHQQLLHSIGGKYGVQPKFIVALWAVESDFGRNMGGFNIISSLATLAYEGRRADFFKAELINALKMVDQDHFTIQDMKGSWAGAMGQTQFMPSSFLELAVDHNGDNKRDIWQTQEDVFASIANYLSKRGWDGNQTWGREIQLPTQFNEALIGKDIEKSISEWSRLGVKQINGETLPQQTGLKASIIRPGKNTHKVYLIYPNYKILLKWNRSLYFATSVGILSDQIQ